VEPAAGTLAGLTLADFRGIAAAKLRLAPGFNVFVGGNAAGKTSVLEAAFLLGRGLSFRSGRLDGLIRHGQPALTVFGELVPGTGFQRVGVEVSRSTGLTSRVDGTAANRAALAAAVLVQLLDPGSQELVRGGPEERRRFLDWGVFHVEPAFLDTWQQYRRALDQRNTALRRGAPDNAVRAWDEPLAEAGVLVDELRRRAVASLTPAAESASERLLDHRAEIDYQPGWAAGDELLAVLRGGLDRDRQMGSTQAGPHRADLRLRLEGRLARNTASRGQEKLLSAALAIAQVEQVAAARERRVVLLVDEPAADLDRDRLARLLSALAAAPAQILVTALDTAAMDLPAGATTFHVERGEVRSLL
jgi:DNA replication and repair protein RecF